MDICIFISSSVWPGKAGPTVATAPAVALELEVMALISAVVMGSAGDRSIRPTKLSFGT